MNKVKKVLCAITVLTLALAMSAMPVLAASATPTVDIAGTVEGIWNGINVQIKDIYDLVVVPAMCVVLAIFIVVEVVKLVTKYNRQEEIKLTKVVLLIIGLIVAASSPAWLPALAGWN